MFVISLICDGTLKQTQIKHNANDAVEVAHRWYEEHKESHAENGYIAIDQSSKGNEPNQRFAEIRFEQDPSQLRLFLKDRRDKAIFTTKYATVTRSFFASFLELALARLTEYIKEKNGGKK